tara:strand:- start:550 stop:732 length:183 start_codon:yes stop_codon:yes gene_type:complete
MTKKQREDLKTIGGLVCQARAWLDDLSSEVEDYDLEQQLEDISTDLQAAESELDKLNGEV